MFWLGLICGVFGTILLEILYCLVTIAEADIIDRSDKE